MKTSTSKYYMPPCVELHSSLWLEDMRKLKVSDFLKGGIMTIDPYVLDGPDDVLHTLNKKFWNVVFLTQDFAERGHGVSGFMYLIDTADGLDIFHYEPVTKQTVIVNKPINLERNFL